MTEETLRYYGVNACFALANARFDDIERAFVTNEGLALARSLLSALAQAKRPYRVVDEAELARVAGSSHHEGICLVARPRPEPTLDAVLAGREPRLLVGLLGVRNPHNIGAILRVAAHFGAHGLLIDRDAPRIAGSLARSAEGGAEHVDVVRIDAVAPMLERVTRAGVHVVSTSSHAKRSLYALPRMPRVLLLFGAEDEGLDEALLTRTTAVAIPGTGAVESLNVATAAAVCLAALTR